MSVFTLSEPHDPSAQTVSAYIDSLYVQFCSDFISHAQAWKSSGLFIRLRRHPEVDGRHAIFWHLISEGDQLEADRTLDHNRCRRLHWVRPLIVQFNTDFPGAGRLLTRWWESSGNRGQGTRYLLATQDFGFVVIVEERQSYALLITAYCVENARRRSKFEREHEAFWNTARAACQGQTAPGTPSAHG